jgi:hypothetical protein
MSTSLRNIDAPFTIILGIIAVLTFPVGQSAFAVSAYNSGYAHGAGDAHTADTSQWYILQPGKGFAFHTPEFNKGYVDGFCANSPPGTGSDADQATFDCPSN